MRNILLSSLLVTIIIFLSSNLYANDQIDQTLLSLKNIAGSFTVSIEIILPSDVKSQNVTIAYGNSQYGYYEKSQLSVQKGQVHFDFIPHGYKLPHEFYLKTIQNNQIFYQFIRTISFDSPLPSVFSPLQITRSGKITPNFIMLSGSLLRKESKKYHLLKKRVTFPYIINKWGEIVWLHISERNGELPRTYPIIKKISSDKFAILYGKEFSFFELIDIKGESLQKFSSKITSMHNDFIYNVDTNNFIGFFRTVKSLGDMNIVSEGPSSKLNIVKNYFKYLLSLPGSLEYFQIQEVNLNTQETKLLWDPFPDLWKQSFFNNVFKDNRIVQKKQSNQMTKEKAIFKQSKILLSAIGAWADYSWCHFNSITHIKEKGYLVSARNLGKIIMFDESFSKILWTLGGSKEDNFFLKNKHDQFKEQHHVSITSRGNILLFDNHVLKNNSSKKKSSRILEIKRDFTNGQAHVIWEYQSNLYSKRRGSVFELDNKNFLTYFPAPEGSTDYIQEIDYTRKEIVGEIVVQHEPYGTMFRAEPLKTLGNERYIGAHLSLAQDK